MGPAAVAAERAAETPPEDLPLNEWLREGNHLYLLRHDKWYRNGKPAGENALTVRVERSRLATDEEAEELTAKLHAFLSALPEPKP